MDEDIIKLNSNVDDEAGEKSDDDEIYEVEKIIGMSRTKGKTLYRVRWLGYDASWDTWEPAENLATCEDLIEKYLDEKKKRQKSQAKISTSSSLTSVTSQMDKDVFSQEDSTDSEVSKASQSSDKKKNKKQGTWKTVDSDDDEFDTLKDKFWRDLEHGNVNVFKSDMYSTVKGSGARSSRPQSFKEMFKSKPLVAESTSEVPNKKRDNSSSSEKSLKLKSPVDDTKPAVSGSTKSKHSSQKSSSNSADKRKSDCEKEQRKSKGKKSKIMISPTEKSKNTKKSSDSQKPAAKLPRLIIKTGKNAPIVVESPESVDADDKSLKMSSSSSDKIFDNYAKSQEQAETQSNSSSSSSTLKDTFWKDLEEGKINVFECDMYSKVKGSGARSSRPKSFKGMFSNQPLVKTESASDKQINSSDSKKESVDTKRKDSLEKKKRETLDKKNKESNSSYKPRETPKKQAFLNESSNNIDNSKVEVPKSKTEDEIPKLLKKARPKPGAGGKFKSAKQQERSKSKQKLPNDSEPADPCKSNEKSAASKEDANLSNQNSKSDGEYIPESKKITGSVIKTSEPEIAMPSRQRSDSESSTEVPTKRIRKSGSLSDVVHENQAIDVDDFHFVSNHSNERTVHSSLNSSSRLEIEEFNLEDFDSTSKSNSSSINNNSGLQRIEKGMDTPSGNREILLDKPMGRDEVDHLFENSPVSGNDGDIDLLRRISEATENNNQNADKELGLDFQDFDISELDIPSTLLDKLKTQAQAQPVNANPPAILNQVEFRRAVKNNEFERILQALKQSKRTYDLEQADPDGVTLAMVCALRGYDEMLELLGRYGANINAETRNGTTALMMACEKNRLCTVNQLIMMGAHINKETSSTCETALLKSVKRGYLRVASVLLDAGCNYNSPTRDDLCASKFAKNYQQRDLLRLITEHMKKVENEFENQVHVTLNNTARLTKALFPIQCLSLSEGESFKIYFKHELQPTQRGVGMLLFIAHARVSLAEVKCRFYGPCAVNAVTLNETKLHPLTEEGNFVMSFGPMLNGRNELEITTAQASTSKAKLLVCAYTAQLI